MLGATSRSYQQVRWEGRVRCRRHWRLLGLAGAVRCHEDTVVGGESETQAGMGRSVVIKTRSSGQVSETLMPSRLGGDDDAFWAGRGR
jgi:hypothetical protein